MVTQINIPGSHFWIYGPGSTDPETVSELLCLFREYDCFVTGLAPQGVEIRKSFPEGLLPDVHGQSATQTTYNRLREAWGPKSYPHLVIKPTRKKAGVQSMVSNRSNRATTKVQPTVLGTPKRVAL